MLAAREFGLTRAGEVNFFVHGEDHCGVENYLNGGFIKMKYRVELTAATALDEKGFLIDNMFISNFMEAAAKEGTELSCELLLDKLARQLQSAMEDAEPGLELHAFTMYLAPYFGPNDVAEMCIKCL